jgi:hypothetical protein
MAEFLPFDEAKNIIKEYQIKSEKDWLKWVKNKLSDIDPKPENIPSLPQIYYKSQWTNWEDWLGLAETNAEYLPFEEARAFIRSLNLENRDEWIRYYQGKLKDKSKPKNIPWNPQTVYEKEFISFDDWIGSQWREFNEAREFVRSLNLNGQIEWRLYCKGELEGYEPKPLDIPANPQSVYGEDLWINTADWLGTNHLRRGPNQTVEDVYFPYEEARKFVHSLGLSDFEEWKEYIEDKFENLPQRPINIPKSPYFVYQNNGWHGWKDWLGCNVVDKIYKEIEATSINILNNLVVLYNPYYNETVIEDHLKVLKEKGYVLFGKIKSKNNTEVHPYQKELEKIYKQTNINNYLQLFLTDYSNVYATKVISISSTCMDENLVPEYYKDFEVETWFMIEDMREIVRDDFTTVRNRILSNFTVPTSNNHTYSIYGNRDFYPLNVNMKNEINYFENREEGYFYYSDMMKSELYISIKKDLIHYNFGSYIFNNLHLNSQESLVSAEIEFKENMNNPLYDFTGAVIKYAKVFELELYLFAKRLFSIVTFKDFSLNNIQYQVQGLNFTLKDYQNNKPNIATTRRLLANESIQEIVNELETSYKNKFFILKELGNIIKQIQLIRNESAHGDSISIADCKKIRKLLLGISSNSVLTQLIKTKDFLVSN